MDPALGRTVVSSLSLFCPRLVEYTREPLELLHDGTLVGFPPNLLTGFSAGPEVSIMCDCGLLHVTHVLTRHHSSLTYPPCMCTCSGVIWTTARAGNPVEQLWWVERHLLPLISSLSET